MVAAKKSSKNVAILEAKKEQVASKAPHAARETVESIVVAVILAFLFRAFIAEAFVIPTGSMAPTLQGRHMDVRCDKCGYPYRTGASTENTDSSQFCPVSRTTCPMCRYAMELRKSTNPNHESFSGDRIIVSKFAYLLGQPKRFEVIVFKYPGNAKQNYIKRLIGLPGETIRIRHGDILVRRGDEGAFSIARKPPHKMLAMLQPVHDTNYRCPDLEQVGWPSHWQPVAAGAGVPSWSASRDGGGYDIRGGKGESWLRYHHVPPWPRDWVAIQQGQRPARLDGFQGQLITDYYEYNDYVLEGDPYRSRSEETQGSCWVGDLALECDLEVQGAEGEILLDLVEGGTHYECRIDVASGRARLSMHGGTGVFTDGQGRREVRPVAQTAVRGPGRYRIRYANVDDEVLLWVNNRLACFDGPTTYAAPENVVPMWSRGDPGDLAPLGVGSCGASLHVRRLRVLRDIYYLAIKSNEQPEYSMPFSSGEIQQIMATPAMWSETSLFASRRTVDFALDQDEFFPLGDNSPQSKDARLWSQGTRTPASVHRTLLIGKAVLIYWPHPWRGPLGLPLVPNLARMGLIR